MTQCYHRKTPCKILSKLKDWPHLLNRLLCPWDFPGKSTGVGFHCLHRLNCSQKSKIHQNHSVVWFLSSQSYYISYCIVHLNPTEIQVPIASELRIKEAAYFAISWPSLGSIHTSKRVCKNGSKTRTSLGGPGLKRGASQGAQVLSAIQEVL